MSDTKETLTITVNIENKVDIIAPVGVTQQDIREAVAHAFEHLARQARSGKLPTLEAAEPVVVDGNSPIN